MVPIKLLTSNYEGFFKDTISKINGVPEVKIVKDETDDKGKRTISATCKDYNLDTVIKGDKCDVSCTCAAFQYYFAYPIYRTGSLLNRGKYNLEPSDTNNPKYKLCCCKHLYKLLTNLPKKSED